MMTSHFSLVRFPRGAGVVDLIGKSNRNYRHILMITGVCCQYYDFPRAPAREFSRYLVFFLFSKNIYKNNNISNNPLKSLNYDNNYDRFQQKMSNGVSPCTI